MTARAHVTLDIACRGVAVYLVDERADGTTALGQPVEIVMRTLGDDEQHAGWHEPTLRLPEPMARALLDALAKHFGGTSDVLTLRKDYMAERARVDAFIAHLTGGRHAQ
ncbi:hypothetical protein AB0873_14895 [Micromonospora sp. NPDC047707]|uniref:hypothetical protein n=1 Tax=Micromonospora sp. NPDC047707 TaxID=3154498 RepID=UPI0034539509